MRPLVIAVAVQAAYLRLLMRIDAPWFVGDAHTHWGVTSLPTSPRSPQTLRSICLLQVADYLRPLMLKDLRVQCRARGINPGGSRDALAERVGEHMQQTQDL